MGRAFLTIGLLLAVVFPAAGAADPLLALPDGKIVVAGAVTYENGFQTAGGLARLSRDGTLDPTFGKSGIVIEHRTVGFSTLAQTADGRLVAGANGSPVLFGYQPDGSLARAFGLRGAVASPSGYGADVNSIIARGGREVIVGMTQSGYWKAGIPSVGSVDAFGLHGNFEGEVGRLPAEGGQFAGDGTSLADVVQQPDGRLVAIGTQKTTTGESTVLLRFAAAPGDLSPFDPSFGNGQGLVNLPSAFEPASLLLDGSAGIVVFGRLHDELALLRYTTEGVPDRSFGIAGVAALGPPARFSDQTPIATALEPDGSIIVVANKQSTEMVGTPYGPTRSHPPEFFLARVNPDGTLDSDFEKAAIESLAASNEVGVHAATGRGIAVQPDGRIILVAKPSVAPEGLPSLKRGDFLISRFNPDGMLDPGFSQDGITLLKVCAGSRNRRVALGCLPRPSAHLRLSFVSRSAPVLTFAASSNASWAHIRTVKLVLPVQLRIAKRYVKGAELPIQSDNAFVLGQPSARQVVFKVKSPRVRVKFPPGALVTTRRLSPRHRLRLRLRVSLYQSQASRTFHFFAVR